MKQNSSAENASFLGEETKYPKHEEDEEFYNVYLVEKGKYRRFTIDVTDAVKDAIENNETSISFELSVDNYTLP